MKFFTFLLSLPLLGASLVIDSGSSTDQLFSGGNAYTIPAVGSTDATLRFGASFSYQIPATDGIPYLLKLNFIEPSSAPPVRSFSVTVNDQLIWTISAMRGYLVPFPRSIGGVMAADGFINIRFNTVARPGTPLPAFRSGPVISSIELSDSIPIAGPGIVISQNPYKISFNSNVLANVYAALQAQNIFEAGQLFKTTQDIAPIILMCGAAPLKPTALSLYCTLDGKVWIFDGATARQIVTQ